MVVPNVGNSSLHVQLGTRTLDLPLKITQVTLAIYAFQLGMTRTLDRTAEVFVLTWARADLFNLLTSVRQFCYVGDAHDRQQVAQCAFAIWRRPVTSCQIAVCRLRWVICHSKVTICNHSSSTNAN